MVRQRRVAVSPLPFHCTAPELTAASPGCGESRSRPGIGGFRPSWGDATGSRAGSVRRISPNGAGHPHRTRRRGHPGRCPGPRHAGRGQRDRRLRYPARPGDPGPPGSRPADHGQPADLLASSCRRVGSSLYRRRPGRAARPARSRRPGIKGAPGAGPPPDAVVVLERFILRGGWRRSALRGFWAGESHN
jgi:hypothetical protein